MSGEGAAAKIMEENATPTLATSNATDPDIIFISPWSGSVQLFGYFLCFCVLHQRNFGDWMTRLQFWHGANRTESVVCLDRILDTVLERQLGFCHSLSLFPGMLQIADIGDALGFLDASRLLGYSDLRELVYLHRIV